MGEHSISRILVWWDHYAGFHSWFARSSHTLSKRYCLTVSTSFVLFCLTSSRVLPALARCLHKQAAKKAIDGILPVIGKRHETGLLSNKKITNPRSSRLQVATYVALTYIIEPWSDYIQGYHLLPVGWEWGMEVPASPSCYTGSILWAQDYSRFWDFWLHCRQM